MEQRSGRSAPPRLTLANKWRRSIISRSYEEDQSALEARKKYKIPASSFKKKSGGRKIRKGCVSSWKESGWSKSDRWARSNGKDGSGSSWAESGWRKSDTWKVGGWQTSSAWKRSCSKGDSGWKPTVVLKKNDDTHVLEKKTPAVVLKKYTALKTVILKKNAMVKQQPQHRHPPGRGGHNPKLEEDQKRSRHSSSKSSVRLRKAVVEALLHITSLETKATQSKKMMMMSSSSPARRDTMDKQDEECELISSSSGSASSGEDAVPPSGTRTASSSSMENKHSRAKLQAAATIWGRRSTAKQPPPLPPPLPHHHAPQMMWMPYYIPQHHMYAFY